MRKTQLSTHTNPLLLYFAFPTKNIHMYTFFISHKLTFSFFSPIVLLFWNLCHTLIFFNGDTIGNSSQIFIELKKVFNCIAFCNRDFFDEL